MKKDTFLIKANNKELKNICFLIRKLVFCKEQNVSQALEIDTLDKTAQHYLLKLNDDFVATGRVYFKEQDNKEVAYIGRVAVLKEDRGKGLGEVLMQGMIKDIKENSQCKKVALSAQVYAKEFYERFGFASYGSTFMDANIPHINMQMTLSSNY
ncbi:GNAT family N-acetyltransferase [Candidatus Hepatincolaceae symbiont of Richtersius coronifer]